MESGYEQTELTPLAVAAPARRRVAIQDACAWVLRVGVITSVAVMVAGLALSVFRHSLSIDVMEHTRFDASPRHLWQGVRELRGRAVIDVGIYLLVLTPIMRVVTSMLFFAFEERDALYSIVTFLVLLLTMAGLVYLH